MLQSTLLKITSALPADKLEAFTLFLASPYFNTNTSLCKLFSLLKQEYPEFNSGQLGKENCFASLFPGKPYKAGTLRNLMTQLTALLREFLIQEKLKESNKLKDRLLLQQYSDLRLEQLFKAFYKRQFLQIEKGQQIDQHQYLWRYLFLKEYQESALCDYRNLEPIHVQKTIFYLDRFILLAKMNMQISTNSRKINLNESTPSTIIDIPNKTCIAQLQAEEKTAFQVIDSIVDNQINLRPDSILSIIHQFKLNSTKYSKPQNNVLLRFLTNLTSRANAIRGNKFYQSLYSLIQFGIENKIVLNKVNITSTGLINFIHMILGRNDCVGAKHFLEKYIVFIPASKRNEVELYSLTLIQFYNQKFDAVSHTLATIKIRESALGFHFRLLMMKNAIELAIKNNNSAKEGLLQLDSIEKYLRRKTSERPRNAELFLNFVRVARRLLKNIQNAVIPITTGIEEFMDPSTPLAARQWLVHKINALE